MDREKVLEKAKQEGILGIDDGSKYTKNQGYAFGKTAVIAVYCIVTLFSLITAAELNAGITAMLAAFLSGEVFSEWRVTKKKIYVVLFAIGIVTTILALAITICDMYGVKL